MNYLDLTIKEIHQALVEKKTTPLELTLEAIKRAKNDTNNAFEYICEKEAIEFAKTLTDVETDNYLWGIPYVLKDNFSTKGIPTTGSSNILNGYIPVYNSTVYKKLTESKAILIAKGTLDELAMGGTGTTGHKGTTFNPYDSTKTRLCGGSSCGSAASVSSSIVPFSIGSDTGDSVRKPASFVGLVGLKPTWGRISRFGLFPFAPSLDHVGFFTRSIEDSAIVLSVLAGRDDLDSTSSLVPADDYVANLHTENTKKWRIAVINQIINSISSKKILETFHKLCSDLKEKGWTIDYVDMNEDLLKAILPAYFVISCAEAGSNNANLDGIKFGQRIEGSTYEELMKNTRTKGFSELIKRRFVIGSYVLLRDNREECFERAQKVRHLIVDSFNDILKNYDGILLPAAPSIAPKINETFDRLSDEYLIADNFMAFANFGGLPSITFPAGFINDMPYGFNLTSRKFEESNLFSMSELIEKTLGFYNLSTFTFGRLKK